MNEFFDSLPAPRRGGLSDVARHYARTLYSNHERLLSAKATAACPYYVGLSSELGSFTHVTKRIALVADTMLLSDHGIGSVHELGELSRRTYGSPFDHTAGGEAPTPITTETHRYGMVTKDLAQVGRWLLVAEPLLRSGLAWYLPVYTRGRSGWHDTEDRTSTSSPGPLPSFSDRSIDFMVEHGRGVDLAGTKPLASRVVRPILEIVLPFIDGLTLTDFAKVTREEFDSYRLYRDFMRSQLLELDDALEAVDSQVALERIALSIRDEANAAAAQMSTAARSRALTRAGALLGTTSAVLAAVRPAALQGALSISATIAAGATGLWPTIQAFADTRPKRAHDKWHYVWVLQKKAAR
ncbi:hypothetical protein PV343_03150 [Streptomyces sp. WI03-4A]|uniref:hypothetical protein n=1 Tax=Streptomyces sp. WI03-4A TaxID=3028706 RepID=UPI0029B0A1B5|nr:hypothetical protein [Streptomyces sp. WI03-4A]MDX2591310.1 hypothetical protein [Streptomyces sp. WI03-4A]